MTTTPNRWFIGSDGSAHRYLVPLDKHAEWLEWTNLDESDERSWDAPAYAKRIDGGLLTFTDPEIGGKKP